jgi:hypothetical protein
MFSVNLTATLRANAHPSLVPWLEADAITCGLSAATVVAPQGVSPSTAIKMVGDAIASEENGAASTLSDLSATAVLAANVRALIWNGLWPVPHEWRIADLFSLQELSGGTLDASLTTPCSASLGAAKNVSASTTFHCTESTTWFERILSVSSSVGDLSSGAVALSGSTIIIARHDPGLAAFPFVGGVSRADNSSLAGGAPLGLEVYFGGIRISAVAASPDGQLIAFKTPPFDAICPPSIVAPVPSSNTAKSSATASQLVRTQRVCPAPRLVLRVPPSDARKAAEPSICRMAGYPSAVSSSAASSSSSLELRRRGTAACPPVCSWSQLSPEVVFESDLVYGSRRRRLQSTSVASGSTAASIASAFDDLQSLSETGFADGEAVVASKALAALTARTAVSSAKVSGFIYSQPCLERINYPKGVTNLQTMCSNSSDPRSLGSAGFCYWGAPPDCKICPESSLCPSGYRLWPRSGFWLQTADSDGTLPVACPYPATERCLGWDSSLGVSVCGLGYAGYACSSCQSPGYYAKQGQCLACPSFDGKSLFVVTILPFLIVGGGILAVAVVLAVITIVVTKRNSGSVKGGLFRLVAFCIGTYTALMVASQTARDFPPFAPPLVQSLMGALKALQGEGVGPVPLACTSVSPLLTPTILMSVGLALESIWLIGFFAWFAKVWLKANAIAVKEAGSCLQKAKLDLCRLCARSPAASSSYQSLSQFSLTGLMLLFAIITTAALSATTCSSQTVSLETYRLLRSDGTTAAAALGLTREQALGFGFKNGVLESDVELELDPATTTFSVSVLASQPEIVCGEGEQAATAGLAMVTGILVIAGLPLLSLLLVQWFAVPTVLKATRVPLVLLKAGLPHFGFGGANAPAVENQLEGAQTAAQGVADSAKADSKRKARSSVLVRGLGIGFKSKNGSSEGDDSASDKVSSSNQAATVELSDMTEWEVRLILKGLEKKRQELYKTKPGAPSFTRPIIIKLCGAERRFLPADGSKPSSSLVFTYSHRRLPSFKHTDEEVGLGSPGKSSLQTDPPALVLASPFAPWPNTSQKEFAKRLSTPRLFANPLQGPLSARPGSFGRGAFKKSAAQPNRVKVVTKHKSEGKDDKASEVTAEAEATATEAATEALKDLDKPIGSDIVWKDEDVILDACGVTLCCRPCLGRKLPNGKQSTACGRCLIRFCVRRFPSAAKSAEDAVDGSLGLRKDVAPIRPLLFGEYRASRFYFLHLNWLIVVATQAATVWLPRDTATASQFIARGVGLMALCFLVAIWSLLAAPQAYESQWKLPMHVAILLLSGVGSLYNSLGSAVIASATVRNGASASTSSLDGLGYLLVLLCIILPFLIVWSFLVTLSSGAKQEKEGEALSVQASSVVAEETKKVIVIRAAAVQAALTAAEVGGDSTVVAEAVKRAARNAVRTTSRSLEEGRSLAAVATAAGVADRLPSSVTGCRDTASRLSLLSVYVGSASGKIRSESKEDDADAQARNRPASVALTAGKQRVKVTKLKAVAEEVFAGADELDGKASDTKEESTEDKHVSSNPLRLSVLGEAQLVSAAEPSTSPDTQPPPALEKPLPPVVDVPGVVSATPVVAATVPPMPSLLVEDKIPEVLDLKESEEAKSADDESKEVSTFVDSSLPSSVADPLKFLAARARLRVARTKDNWSSDSSDEEAGVGSRRSLSKKGTKAGRLSAQVLASPKGGVDDVLAKAGYAVRQPRSSLAAAVKRRSTAATSLRSLMTPRFMAMLRSLDASNAAAREEAEEAKAATTADDGGGRAPAPSKP